jgi:hypothetical protein
MLIFVKLHNKEDQDIESFLLLLLRHLTNILKPIFYHHGGTAGVEQEAAAG